MPVTVALDYLRGTCYFKSSDLAETFLDRICEFLSISDRWSMCGHSAFLGERYDQAFRSIVTKFSGGLRREKAGGYKLLLDLPGRFMSSVSSLPLVTFLVGNQFRFTRLDVALDDYDRRISFDDVRQAGESGNFLYLNYFEFLESSVHRGSPVVPTCYFGKSDKKIRFYNAEFVHDIKADRWELQLRGDWAKTVVSEYIDSPNCLGSLVVGFIDFGVSRLDYHCFDRFPWWESLRSDVDLFSLPSLGVKDKSSIEPMLDWLYSQVAPSLAVLYRGLPEDVFNSLIKDICDNGGDRFKSYHNDWVKHLKVHGLSEVKRYER